MGARSLARSRRPNWFRARAGGKPVSRLPPQACQAGDHGEAIDNVKSREQSFDAVDGALEIVGQERPAIKLDYLVFGPSQGAAHARRTECDQIARRRLGGVEPRRQVFDETERGAFGGSPVRGVVAPPRGDIRKGVDLAVLNQNRLRRGSLGEDDLAAGQGYGRRADANLAGPSSRGERPVFRDDRGVGGGECGEERLRRRAGRRRKRLLERAQGDPGKLETAWRELDRLDARQQHAAMAVRSRRDVDVSTGFGGQTIGQCKTGRDHGSAAHAASPPRLRARARSRGARRQPRAGISAVPSRGGKGAIGVCRV